MKIALLGDIGLFGKFSLSNGLDIERYFSDIRDKISDCDLIIGNLEIPFSEKKKEFAPKSACIASEPCNIDILKYLGISYVNLANNHIGDFGSEGYDLTKNILKKAQIGYFGIENKHIELKFADNNIALIGFCNMDANPVYLRGIDNNDEGVNVANVAEIVNLMSNNHQNGLLNILSFHSGLEHVHLPGQNDINFARYLSSLFPYIYYGHHPHVVQGYESINYAHIFYSLGNFCFDDVYSPVSKKPLVEMSDANRIGVTPIITIESNKVVNVEKIWHRMSKSKLEIIDRNDSNIIELVEKSLTDISLVEIEKLRSNILKKNNYLRTKKRDITWFLNRLNFKYFRLFFRSRKNRKLYLENFSDQIKNLDG